MAIEDYYKQSVIFQTRVDLVDETGADDPSGTWTAFSTVPCMLQPLGGNQETFNSKKEIVIRSHRLFCSSISGLTEQDRALIGSRTFDIVGFKDGPNSLDHHFEISLLERV